MALNLSMYVISFMQVGLWTSHSRERAGCRIRQLVNSSVVLKSSGENMLNRIKNSCNVWLLYPSRILCITLLPFNMSFFFS